MKTNKLFIITTTLAMAIIVLSACGSSDKNDKKKSSSKELTEDTKNSDCPQDVKDGSEYHEEQSKRYSTMKDDAKKLNTYKEHAEFLGKFIDNNKDLDGCKLSAIEILSIKQTKEALEQLNKRIADLDKLLNP